MAALKNCVIQLMTIIGVVMATPTCKTYNDKDVVCTAGSEDYELVRGLVSDNDRTTGVTLRNCRIIDVEYESFNDLTSLKYLDLSENKISRLKLGVLDEPKQLTSLNLSYNLLEEFPLGLFDQTINIDTLDLKANKIKNLELGIFDPIHNLKYLDLSINALRGKDLSPYIFDQSPHITHLDFSRNDLTDTPETMLQAFEELEYLNLDRTFLKEVPAFATKPNLKTMKKLILSGNQITALDSSTIFMNLDHLEAIDLSFNSIETINGDIFQPLKNIHKIVLNNNKIKVIPDNLFRNIPKLLAIQMAGNEISDVPVNAFRGAPLKYLNLANNKITYLIDNFCLEIQNSGGRLKKFLFDPNPWQCACLLDLLKEVKRMGIDYNNSKYDGTHKVCATTNEFYCNRHQRFNEIYIDMFSNTNDYDI